MLARNRFADLRFAQPVARRASVHEQHRDEPSTETDERAERCGAVEETRVPKLTKLIWPSTSRIATICLMQVDSTLVSVHASFVATGQWPNIANWGGAS